MATTKPQISTRQAWILASRPKTLPAAAAPVLVGSAIALAAHTFSPLPALAALLGALLIQIGTNFANDVFDFKKGADKERVGPLRAVQAGLITPRQMFMGMWVVFGLATLIGLYLVYVGGWPIVVIGLLSILSGIAYTGGPFPLGYNGLGDIFVFIFFGLVAVGGTYYVQAGNVSTLAWWGAIAVGLLGTAIIVVNNLRDIDTDRKVGKKTLAVRLGAKATQSEYFALLAGAYLVPPVIWALNLAGGWVMLSWLSLPLAWQMIRQIQLQKGRALIPVLAGTARLEMVYSLLFALGLALTAL